MRLGPEQGTLEVRAELGCEVERTFRVDPEAERFVRDLQVRHGRARGARVQCEPPGCLAFYRFFVGAAARDREAADLVFADAGAYAAPASLWLLHVPGARPRTVRVRAGPRVIVPGAVDRDGRFEVNGTGLDEGAYFAFGNWRDYPLRVGGTSLLIAVAPERRAMPDDAVVRWVASAAASVASYFDGLPGSRPLILVVSGDRSSLNGKTLGGAGASILAELGAQVGERQAREDWVLVHEMIHLALPSLGPPHQWLEEGLATYLEPVVRARAGDLAPDEVWREWVRDMPQGLPRTGDLGLERTHTWERTYWGGALFCLMADLTLRLRTRDVHSIEDSVRAIARRSGGVSAHWSIEDVLDAADAASGEPVWTALYRSLGNAPGNIDLDTLFARLGVSVDGDRVVLDDGAAWAALRRSMLAPHAP